MDKFSIASPEYSMTYPVPPAVPILPMINIVISLAVTPFWSFPTISINIFFCFWDTKHWVAKTCSTSLVPIPIANDPKAPWVDVWESPQTIVMPGSVIPCSGPITWTIPCLSSLSLNWFIPNSSQLSFKVTTWSLLIGSLIPSMSFARSVVGTLWSGVAIIVFIWRGIKLFWRRPSNACGEVTSCTRCRSMYISVLPSSLSTTKCSSQILS